MAAFVLRHPNGTTLNLNSAETKTAVSKAEQTCSFMADDTITINVVSATPLTFYIGDTLDILGTTYTLNQLPTAVKQGSRSFTYTLTLEGVQYELIEATFLLNDNTKLDSFTGTLADFADRIVENANRVAEGEKWVIASVDITEAKTLTYTDQNCLQVLQSICEEWNKKFRIRTENGKRKITIADEVGNPYTPVFRYGEIDGLYKVTREKADDTSVITRLYTYGSSENLGNGYRHNRLCLPTKEKNQSYIQDANKVALFGIKEGVKAFENIRPERVGSVTSIIESDKLSFVDSTMFDLKAKKSNGKDTMYLISGTTAKVTFQTGGLAGYELEIEDYDHSTHEFKLVQFTDSNGDTFPSYDLKAFQIAVGDKYVLSDIMLPDEYIADAESRLQAEARSYYDSYSHPQIKYSIEVLPKWLKANLGSLGTDSLLFYPGDFVNVEDADLGIDGRIRIESITHDLLNTYQYTLNLADNTLPNALQRVIGAITKNQQDIKIENVNNAANLRKAYRVTEELKEMVFDTDGYFTDKIKPSTIETAMLAVGAKSQQFTIKDCLFQANYNSNANSVHVGAGSLHHFGIAEDIKVWNIAEQDITNLVSSRSYYVYAQCNKTTSSASINISTEQRRYDSDSTYYFFLIGTLSSVYKSGAADIGSRALSLTYGSTTINGRFITTGCIQGTNGKLTIDLDNCKIYAEEMEFLGLDQQPQSVASRFNAVDTEVSGVKATAEATAQRFDNLQIGGRNLVLKSTYTEDSPYTLKPTSEDTYVTVCQAAALTKGKEYTLQCNTDGLWGQHMQAQRSRLCTMWMQYHNADGTTSTKYQCFGGTYPNESGRKTWTFTAPYDCSRSSIRLNVYGDGNPSVNFWHIQLEEGNVATSWSPAPEDLIINVDDTITSVDVEYALSTSTTTAPTSGWQTTAPTWENGKYMWQRTKRTLKNGTSSYSNPTCIQGARGTDGTNGTNGKDGANGSNGISITKVEEQYQLHTSATTAPTGTWSGSVIYPIPDGKYLWYRSKITYSNNTATYTTPIVDNALIVANEADNKAEDAQEMTYVRPNLFAANTSKGHKGAIEFYSRYYTFKNGVYTYAGGGTAYCGILPKFIVEYEKVYTLSLETRSDKTEGDIACYIMSSSYTQTTGFIKPFAIHFQGEWKRHYYNFSVPSSKTNAASGLYFRYDTNANVNPTGNNIYIKNIKVEEGSVPSVFSYHESEDARAFAAEADYLKECLPPGGSTETIGGGLLLTSILGVRNAAGQVTAGLNGSSGDTSDNTPMIWAGSQGANTMGESPFRVYKDGVVHLQKAIFNGNGENDGTFMQAGYLTLQSNGAAEKTQLDPSKMSDIKDAADASVTTTHTISTGYSSNAISIYRDAPQASTSGSETALTIKADKAGTIQLPSSIAISASCSGTSISHKCTFSASVALKKNGAAIVSYSSRATDSANNTNANWALSVSVPLESGTKHSVTVNDTITIVVSWTFSVTFAKTGEVPFTGYVQAKRNAFTTTQNIASYKNTIFSNGMLLQSSANKYFGVKSDASTDIVLARNGNFGIALTAQGLQQLVWSSSNAITRYRMNPLVMVVKFTFANNGYTAAVRYNPLGAAFSSSVARKGVGDVQFNHNLNGKGANTLSVVYAGQNNQLFGATLELTNTYVRFGISDDGSRNDGNIELSIYDLGTY